MILRSLLHRQSLLALILCPLLFFGAEKMKLQQPKVLTPSLYQYTPLFFKFVTAGFWPAAVDGLWIRTLQFIGEGNYAPATLPEAEHFYDLATDLDPNFYELYDQAGLLFLFFYENPERAEKFLKKGIDVFLHHSPPKDFWFHPHTLYIYLAYVQAFQENNWAEAKKTYLAAAELPTCPQYILNMKKWLKEENSEKILAKKVLNTLIENTTDEAIKQKYQEKLKHYE